MDPTQVRRILVMKFWGIGSLVLAEPFFRQARVLFPDAEIHVMTLVSNRAVMDLLPGIDRVRYVDLGGSIGSAIAAYLGCMWRTFRGGYDVVIDMEFYTRASAVVALSSLARVRIGYHAQGVYRGGIQSHKVPFNAYWHVSRNFLSLLEPYGHGQSADVPVPVLALPDAPHSDAGVLWSSLGDQVTHYVVINVNAGELAYERRWFPDRFADLAARLSQTYDVACVFIGAAGERDYVARVVEQAKAKGARVWNTTGALSLTAMAQVCAQSRLVISNDSGPLHVAAASGASVVGFFGPETPVLYGPAGVGHTAFYLGLNCSPCINVEHGKRIACRFPTPHCQDGITVDDVLARIDDMYGTRLRAP